MAHIETDTQAISDNVAALRERTGKDIIVVVKANAYGHGAEFASAAAVAGEAVALATADIAEVIAVRKLGCSVPLMAWLHSSAPKFVDAHEHDIQVVISSVQRLDHVAAAHVPDRPFDVHLKFDTGLGRNGIPQADWRVAIERADALQRRGRIRVVGLMSHLAGTSEAADRQQAELFETLVAKAAYLGAERTHLSASNGALTLSSGNAVRIGIAAYGLHPEGHDADGAMARELGLRPALRLLARAENGVVDVGFRDGLLPAPGAWMLVDGERVSIISQDARSTTLERPVTGQAVVIGDPARGEPGAGAWAEQAGTINYEIVTRLAPGLERRPV
ncbi:alanine racemase [Agrococcus casei]|uniref:Alanine racemase n=1 Tax=Agrococcus casei LMG 22410 TaxID=1255656 RepID=A0A1R4FC90_9MICO|nr:alanine racemase [Agrococcus casei]SJM53463.1 Alanine racemase [Agrococcus casei LMG 22410]